MFKLKHLFQLALDKNANWRTGTQHELDKGIPSLVLENIAVHILAGAVTIVRDWAVPSGDIFFPVGVTPWPRPHSRGFAGGRGLTCPTASRMGRPCRISVLAAARDRHPSWYDLPALTFLPAGTTLPAGITIPSGARLAPRTILPPCPGAAGSCCTGRRPESAAATMVAMMPLWGDLFFRKSCFCHFSEAGATFCQKFTPPPDWPPEFSFWFSNSKPEWTTNKYFSARSFSGFQIIS